MFNEDKRLEDLIRLISHGEKLRSAFVGRSLSTEISPIDGLSWYAIYAYCKRDCLLDHDAADLGALREKRSLKFAERAEKEKEKAKEKAEKEKEKAERKAARAALVDGLGVVMGVVITVITVITGSTKMELRRAQLKLASERKSSSKAWANFQKAVLKGTRGIVQA